MAKIWVLIIAGVILFPFVSKIASDYESKLESNELKSEEEIKKAEFRVKLIKYTVWGSFGLIAILVAVFAAELMP